MTGGSTGHNNDDNKRDHSPYTGDGVSQTRKRFKRTNLWARMGGYSPETRQAAVGRDTLYLGDQFDRGIRHINLGLEVAERALQEPGGTALSYVQILRDYLDECLVRLNEGLEKLQGAPHSLNATGAVPEFYS